MADAQAPNKLSLQVATRNTSLSDSNILSPWACSSKIIWLNLANWWLVPHLGQVPLGYETLTQSFANRTLNPPSHRLRPLPRRWDLSMSPAWMVQVWALYPALVEENPVHHLERIDGATPMYWFIMVYDTNPLFRGCAIYFHYNVTSFYILQVLIVDEVYWVYCQENFRARPIC